MSKKSQVVSHTTVFQSQLFTVEEVLLTSDTGHNRTHFDIHRKPTVSVFPLTENYEIYLIHQYRVLHDSILLEGIAGYIDDGESPLSAGKRELKEETGIIASSWQELATVQMSASVIDATAHLFVAKGFSFEQATPEENEEIELVRMSLDEAVNKVMSGEISTSVSKIGILMLDKLRQEGKI